MGLADREKVAWFVEGTAKTTMEGTIRAVNSKGKVVYERSLDGAVFDDVPISIQQLSPYTGSHDGLTLELAFKLQIASFDDGNKK